MRKIRWLFSTMALALIIGVVSAPAGTAASGAAPDVRATDVSTSSWGPQITTFTTKEAWVRQCAAMHCGHHVVTKGTTVWGYCSTVNAGIRWNVVWTEDDRAGHIDVTAMNTPTSVPCDTAGVGPIRPTQELWAHSCPSMGCGYGVMSPGHDVARLDVTPPREGRLWNLALDHDSPNKNLVGFVDSAYL